MKKKPRKPALARQMVIDEFVDYWFDPVMKAIKAHLPDKTERRYAMNRLEEAIVNRIHEDFDL